MKVVFVPVRAVLLFQMSYDFRFVPFYPSKHEFIAIHMEENKGKQLKRLHSMSASNRRIPETGLSWEVENKQELTSGWRDVVWLHKQQNPLSVSRTSGRCQWPVICGDLERLNIDLFSYQKRHSFLPRKNTLYMVKLAGFESVYIAIRDGLFWFFLVEFHFKCLHFKCCIANSCKVSLYPHQSNNCLVEPIWI